MFKVANKKNIILKFAKKVLKTSHQFEKLMLFLVSSMLICHIFACLWIFFSQFADENESTWLTVDFKKMSIFDLYISSFYFTITTFSTVGYGDISGQNSIERSFCVIIMIVGVTAFAWGTSVLTNLLQNYDKEDEELDQKMLMLSKIYDNYCIPLKLYDSIKKSISTSQQDNGELYSFLEDLPHDLKLEASLFIFEKTFKKIIYLKNRPVTFIAWICPLLKSLIKSEDQYVFFEGDELSCIYFH